MWHKLKGMLNIDYPLFQGAMAWIAGGQLAGAVSAAGGLGIIGAAGADVQWLQTQIQLVRSLTDRPFGVNLMLADAHINEVVKTIIAENVPVVTTGGGNPGRYMESLKQAGIKVIPVVSSAALAKRLCRLGADAVIAEGMESGGHVGEMTTMSLVPMVVDAVAVPVIAAGGIADGRGMMAAFALGAGGVQVGTRFICASECNVHEAYRQKVLWAKDRDTRVCGTTTGHPVRSIRNQFTREYLQKERAGWSKEDLAKFGQGAYPAAAIHGNIKHGSVMAGQICGLVHKIQPAADIIEEIITEALQIQKNMGGWLCPD